MSKDLRKLSKLRRREELKKQFHEGMEELEATGQESDKKAVKYVDEIAKRDEKKLQEEREKQLDILSKKRKGPKIFSYKEHLAIELANRCREDIGKGWWFRVNITDKGIVLIIGRPGFQTRRRAFKISGDPKYDFNAVERFAFWLWSATGSANGEDKSKIIVP